MNTQRLLQLASFLRKLPPERFDFGKVVEHQTPRCGTIGCAIGWTPACFPELVEWRKGSRDGLRMVGKLRNDYYDDIAVNLFGISRDDAVALFTPNHQDQIDLKEVDDDATPSQVADLIEEYVRLKS